MFAACSIISKKQIKTTSVLEQSFHFQSSDFIEEAAVLAQFSPAKPTLILIKPDSYRKLGLQIVQQMQFKLWEEMVFCNQNFSGLLWEKIVLVTKKNFEADGR